jgi:hypothetical protein
MTKSETYYLFSVKFSTGDEYTQVIMYNTENLRDVHGVAKYEFDCWVNSRWRDVAEVFNRRKQIKSFYITETELKELSYHELLFLPECHINCLTRATTGLIHTTA